MNSQPSALPRGHHQEKPADKKFTVLLGAVMAILALPICLPPWPAINLEIDIAPGVSDMDIYRSFYVLGIGWLIVLIAGLYIPFRAIRQLARQGGAGQRVEAIDIGLFAVIMSGFVIDITAYLAVFG